MDITQPEGDMNIALPERFHIPRSSNLQWVCSGGHGWSANGCREHGEGSSMAQSHNSRLSINANKNNHVLVQHQKRACSFVPMYLQEQPVREECGGDASLSYPLLSASVHA